MQNSLYFGTVIHNRVRPIKHKLRYRVFSMFVDCDGFTEISQKCRLFSHNRFNLFSLYDRDFGDGENLQKYLQQITNDAMGKPAELSFKMLCYPRILGYGFNPLTVYYGLGEHDEIRMVIYEVRNTFGERKTYAIPARFENNIIAQQCEKQLYVSPFNDVSGNYLFRLTQPKEDLTVGVALRNDDGPILTALFRGKRESLNDKTLLRALGRMGWMTVKVTVGIHYEALKLWLKGLSLKTRPDGPKNPVTIFAPDKRKS